MVKNFPLPGRKEKVTSPTREQILSLLNSGWSSAITIIDIEQKRLVSELNKELIKIDFKKYANCEQITADELLKMDE